MSPAVQLREEADRDLAAAASWYEQQQVGLGHKFLDEALSALQLIAEQPLIYPIIHRKTRRTLMHRFPFGIFYRVEESHIVVLAVLHGSRHPYKWQIRT